MRTHTTNLAEAVAIVLADRRGMYDHLTPAGILADVFDTIAEVTDSGAPVVDAAYAAVLAAGPDRAAAALPEAEAIVPAPGTPVYSTRRDLAGVIDGTQLHLDLTTRGQGRPYVWVDFSAALGKTGPGWTSAVYLADLVVTEEA